MVSTKAIAAIALTLVVACPIALGYVLAIDEQEAVSWETTQQYNVSDYMLNSSTDYTMPISSPANNSELVQKVYAQGQYEYSITAPAYNDVGDTYTSLPTYTETSGSTVLSQIHHGSRTLTQGQSVGNSVSDTQYLGPRDFTAVSVSGFMGPHVQLTCNNYITMLSNTDFFTVTKDSATTWLLQGSFLDEPISVTTWQVITDAECTVDYTTRDYSVLSITSTGGAMFSLTKGAGLRVTTAAGSFYEVMTYIAPVTLLPNNVLQVNGNTYTGVTAYAVVETGGRSVLEYTATTPDGRYADPSAGWKLPTGQIADYSWFNGQQNKSATFLLDMPNGSSCTFVPNGGGTVTVAKLSDGDLTVGDVYLGKYSKVMVEIGSEGFTVSGINAWPPLGATPTTFNTVTVDADISLFEQVQLNASGAISFRCDGAEILAGSFPSTKDYTLDFAELFPNALMSLKLNSIGVYGDTLTVGSTSYPVTNGRILVDGKAVNLKGAVISFTPEEDGLTGFINGRELGSFAAQPPITFGGEWSLTAIAYKVEEVSSSSMEWNAGGFGLDKDGFIAAGLLTACAAFVLLGMYGRASGTKVGLLAVICGGAAIVYIMLI